MLNDTVISILRRMIEAGDAPLSAAVAEAVLRLQFDDQDQSRLGELAGKSNHGTLSSAEEVEYDAYIAAADLLSLWKSKARLSLNHQTAA